MSSPRLPATSARERPENLAILLREPMRLMTDLLYERLAGRGFDDFRVAHGAVFQYLDDEGTSVSELARRASITKQSMAELVRHLEGAGYVERFPDPGDRRARLVRTTARGREVFAIARTLARELEDAVASRLGRRRLDELRATLAELKDALPRPAGPHPMP